MKKIFTLALALSALVLTVSCGTKSASPGAAAKAYMEAVAAGDYEKFVDGMYFGPDATAEETEEARTMWLSMIREKGTESLEENEGIKSIEVLSEEVVEEGKIVDVTLNVTYGNGETKETGMRMVHADGRWLMNSEK